MKKLKPHKVEWEQIDRFLASADKKLALAHEILDFEEEACRREDNLLAVQPKRFVVTTNSNHKLEVYLNLASRMKLTGIDQLWVADITYIRLKAEFVYLAVIVDSFSRKVVGWALDRTLASRLTIGALEQAIEKRQPEPGLVHHSDRGLQYACAEYVAIIEKYRMVPSVSRPANPMEFFENDENGKGASTGLLGTGTPSPSPSPDPISC